MTNFAKPVAQRPQNWLAQLRGLAAANAAGGTAYTVEYPKRQAGETIPESERGVSVAITGNVETDHEGTATGLSGWGQAVKNTSSGNWEKLGEDSGWITATLENSWVKFGSYELPSYRKIGSQVLLRGVFAHSGSAGSAAFTLPIGFRPAYQCVFAGGSYPPADPVDVFCITNGQVIIEYGGTPEQISIDGINFTID